MTTDNDALRIAYKALDDKFGKDIVLLDIREISIFADYFMIATGSNANQTHAMANEVIEKLRLAGIELRHSEGINSAEWILLDFNGLIVHIFDENNRSFYSLERIWADAKKIDGKTL